MPHRSEELPKCFTSRGGDISSARLPDSVESKVVSDGAAMCATLLASYALPPSVSITIGALGAFTAALAQDLVPKEEKEIQEFLDHASKFSKSLAISGIINGVASSAMNHGKKKRA